MYISIDRHWLDMNIQSHTIIWQQHMGRKPYTNLILYSTVTVLFLKHNCHNFHLNTIKASDKSEKEGE